MAAHNELREAANEFHMVIQPSRNGNVSQMAHKDSPTGRKPETVKGGSGEYSGELSNRSTYSHSIHTVLDIGGGDPMLFTKPTVNSSKGRGGGRDEIAHLIHGQVFSVRGGLGIGNLMEDRLKLLCIVERKEKNKSGKWKA